jgi:2'-hydroxyisoflavone reductase
MTSRRDFLRTTALAAGTIAAAATPAFDAAAQALRAHAVPAPLDILILGGTGFIGPHLVRHAVSRGHRVTIFTRGRRDADLPAGITRLVGDRNGQLGALAGKKWDAVIDDSATNPDWVRQSTAMLKDAAGRYLFTSSTGVYYPYLTPKADESVAVHSEQVNANDADEAYGVAKAKCEIEVMRVFGNRGLVVRPTYIVGPGDTSNRFPYWVPRLQRGGEVLAPGRREDPVQWVDVRDLVAFYVKLLEDQRTGTFNGVSAATTIPSREFYESARRIINPAAQYVFVDDYDLLDKHKIVEVVPWVLLKGNNLHATSVASSKSAAAGLSSRPLADTLRDTIAWWPTTPETRRQAARFAITPELEATVLAEFRAKRG